MQVRTGGCLCGAVRFEITGEVRDVVYCHCGQCRRQSGHYVAATSCADDGLSVEGAEAVTWYAASPDARRGFCSKCGSLLFWKANGSAFTSIMAGSFDAPSGLRESHHIHVADKGDYYALADNLPQYPGGD